MGISPLDTFHKITEEQKMAAKKTAAQVEKAPVGEKKAVVLAADLCLLSGATLGGNLTPVGASANIAGIGILRKEGYTVKNGDFFKIGIPFTLAAIVPAYIIIWLFFGV